MLEPRILRVTSSYTPRSHLRYLFISEQNAVRILVCKFRSELYLFGGQAAPQACIKAYGSLHNHENSATQKNSLRFSIDFHVYVSH